jgi:hypothetical protein
MGMGRVGVRADVCYVYCVYRGVVSQYLVLRPTALVSNIEVFPRYSMPISRDGVLVYVVFQNAVYMQCCLL